MAAELHDWKPIKKVAVDAASVLGHDLRLRDFGRSSKPVKTAHCETCFGCCWVAYTLDGFKAGGRILKYRCGDPKAMSLINAG